MFLNRFGKKDKFPEDVFHAEPRFYQKNGEPLGVYALTESTDTVFPCAPYAKVDGNALKKWELLLVALKDGPIGSVDYNIAIKVFREMNMKEKGNEILVKGLGFEELVNFYEKCLTYSN